MFVPFEKMPGTSKIWIYQGSRPFSADEQKTIEAKLKQMCEDWTAHGNPLQTSFSLHLDQFVVLAVNELGGAVSGCSIDGSVRALKELKAESGIEFLDRGTLAFWVADKVILHSLEKTRQLIGAGTLTGDSLTFNNVLETKDKFEREWKTPIHKSWLNIYLPKTAVAK